MGQIKQERLIEISNNLHRMPAMEERLKSLNKQIAEAERNVLHFKAKYEAESINTEKFERQSLSVILLKLTGKYESRLKQAITYRDEAGLQYDKAVERLKELNKERMELGEKIADLRRDRQLYEAELKRRESELRQNPSDERTYVFNELDQNINRTCRHLKEIDEAIAAARQAKQTATRITEILGKADGWATYDVWFKGGIISHMAKYGHVDKAKDEFSRLQSQLNILRRELQDINENLKAEYTGIDPTTRAVDFWFDNIFTDWNVRKRIRSDREQALRLTGALQRVISALEKNKSAAQHQLNSLNYRKKELLLNR
ncbi:MAG: hypothetical protein ACOX27_09410 [Caldicoprobacterales bacterium]|nr:hypothetical protein [Clostridiales bacterium]